ncbi:hypothetical protein BpHYR1_012256 [Brachionus plicatilis]|uniref:Transmembrane protein n=1 Tax=Brachionus plicatilis TaxID=10195 RepID=A0A3M7S940_BRAPC|nr:hypothetical protein BpHYR1_012256 [Brachionus plicatilis]
MLCGRLVFKIIYNQNRQVIVITQWSRAFDISRFKIRFIFINQFDNQLNIMMQSSRYISLAQFKNINELLNFSHWQNYKNYIKFEKKIAPVKLLMLNITSVVFYIWQGKKEIVYVAHTYGFFNKMWIAYCVLKTSYRNNLYIVVILIEFSIRRYHRDFLNTR